MPAPTARSTWVFIADGKGGHQRLVPVSSSFFAAVAAYLDTKRPADTGTDRVFAVLKGPNRGKPFSVRGLDEIWPARGRTRLVRRPRGAAAIVAAASFLSSPRTPARRFPRR